LSGVVSRKDSTSANSRLDPQRINFDSCAHAAQIFSALPSARRYLYRRFSRTAITCSRQCGMVASLITRRGAKSCFPTITEKVQDIRDSREAVRRLGVPKKREDHSCRTTRIRARKYSTGTEARNGGVRPEKAMDRRRGPEG